MNDNSDKGRRRMVVEEIGQISNEAASDIQDQTEKNTLEEVKEKVEELQDITEHMSDDVKQSAEVQEEIVEATEKTEPSINQVQPTQPQVSEFSYPKVSNGTNPLVVIIPGVLLLGALLGGIVFYQKSVNESPIEIIPTPTESPIASSIPSATPTPIAKLDLTKYTVVIFNGSGISGEAGKVKTLITTAGFKVGTTGNAATYDFTKTVVKTKSTVDSAFTAKLVETLGKNYVVDKAQVLDSASKNDVEITVGTSKAI